MKPFVIVASRFNESITDSMVELCLKTLKEKGFEAELIRVPGAAEIPWAVQEAILKFSPKVVLTLGCVIRGETEHYDAICQIVSDGIRELSLKHRVPIIFEVLMCDTLAKAQARISKGRDAALSAIEISQVKF